MKLPPMRSRAPLAIASFIAIPLFFSSLMASSLALEKPHVYQWRHAGRLFTTFHEPTAWNEARIWLWALVPPLLLILAGFVASYLPYGFYVSCAAAIVIAVAVVHRLDRWTLHHTLRFPNGVDLIPASNAASNKYDPGQWEQNARDTALSLQHWTIGLAVASALILAFITFRREVLGRRPVPAPPPLESVHGPDVTPPSLPER